MNAITKFLGLLVLIGLTGQAQSAVVEYTDEADFLAALSAFTTYDFDGFVPDEGADAFGPFDVLDTQFAGLDFDNAQVIASCCGGGVVSPPNVVLNSDWALGGGAGPIVINFGAPVFALGVWNASIVDAERFEIFAADDSSLGVIELPPGTENFGGFISDMAIARASISPMVPTNGSIFIDNLTVGTPVPLPAALPLFAAGLMLLRGFRTYAA